MLCLIFSSLLWWVWSIAIFMSVGLSVLAYLKNRMSKVREICYLWLWFSLLMTMQHVVDSIWAMSIVWRTRRKIVVTVLCCILYNSCAQWYAKNGLRYAIRPLSCPVLSVCDVGVLYCGQTAGWIKMQLGMEVGLGPSHIVLDGDPAPPSQKGQSFPILAHVCCCQTAGWIKMWTQFHHGKGNSIPHFLAHVCCGQMVADLSNCWALVLVTKIGWEEHLQNDLFCVEWDIKP